MEKSFKFTFLSSNVIKVLASIFMVIDHVGYILFPELTILRILGRLSMPLFAFMIAEGAYYTKNKIKYFSLIFVLGLIFQVVFYVAEQSLYMGILITFSISILIIYALQFFQLKLNNGSLLEKIYSILLFALLVALTYWLNIVLQIDYGFWGCLLPVFGSVLRIKSTKPNGTKICFNVNLINLLTFAIGLTLLCLFSGGIQYYALLTLPILFFYSGKRGKFNLKYFFYIFYPAHMVIIYGIAFLL
ncbi:MAG: hypothetical protein IKW33_01650 [Clostridia bacterium]|nr:hypothetical protein [Clostridia bacterium]